MKNILLLVCLALVSLVTRSQNIIEMEYFFDVDSGFGKNIIVPVNVPDSEIFLSDTLSFPANLSTGYHKLYSRVRDSFGNWSHTMRRYVEVIKEDDSLFVVEVEYFFADNAMSGLDFGFDNCNSSIFQLPFIDGATTFYIPFDSLPWSHSGDDTLFLRVCDSLNTNWSQTIFIDSINLSIVGMSEINLPRIPISPNPSTGNIRIDLKPDINSPMHLEIINMLGEKLHEQILDVPENNVTLDYPDGLYNVILQTSSGMQSQVIILRRQ